MRKESSKVCRISVRVSPQQKRQAVKYAEAEGYVEKRNGRKVVHLSSYVLARLNL